MSIIYAFSKNVDGTSIRIKGLSWDKESNKWFRFPREFQDVKHHPLIKSRISKYDQHEKNLDTQRNTKINVSTTIRAT